jgi:hypothetical protein
MKKKYKYVNGQFVERKKELSVGFVLIGLIVLLVGTLIYLNV